MNRKSWIVRLVSCCLALLCACFLWACGSVELAYTVEFIVDGEIVATVGTDKQTIKMPKDPQKEGYTFDGWYWDDGEWEEAFTLNSIGDQPITEENRFQVHAKWKSATEYFVKFYNGTGSGEMADAPMKVGKATALPKNTFTPTVGYVFDGWNTEQDGTGSAYADGQNVLDLCAAGEYVSLYAQWRKATCTLSFDANGGTGSMQARKAFTYDAITVPCAFTPPTGKQFDGWNTQADGKGTSYGYLEKAYFSVAPDTEIVLYAQWREKAKEYYTISFHTNGGSGTMSSRRVERDKEITVGQPTFTPPADHGFDGWNTKADGSGQSIAADETVVNLTEANETVALYAQWTNVSYTIMFYNSNGADSTYTTRKAYQNEEITLGGAGAFVAPAYCQFEGWRVEAETPDLNGWRRIGADEKVSNLARPGETVSLCADWKLADGYTLQTVSSFAQLKGALQSAVGEKTVIVLLNDIDCAGNIIPSCPELGGAFMGNGHAIKNLIIEGEKSGNVMRGGLFGNITATGRVEKLALEGVRVIGNYAASFAYKNEGTICNSYVCDGTVNFVGNSSVSDVTACGLVCENAEGGELFDCYFTGRFVGQLQTGSFRLAGICFKNAGEMNRVYFYGTTDVAGSVAAANLFCVQMEGSMMNVAYGHTGELYCNGVVYDGSLECADVPKWTAEEFYQNRYDMAIGGIMYEEMNVSTWRLGSLAYYPNIWYHL